ncbi:hypothetical protein M3Y95_00215200 [Aphelenchoides besseyi]|nr:hypothetical protein M3Y95_00215200 [Aphelenchoides besseyi]
MKRVIFLTSLLLSCHAQLVVPSLRYFATAPLAVPPPPPPPAPPAVFYSPLPPVPAPALLPPPRTF